MSRAVGAGTCERGARKVWAARPGTVAWTLAALALALGAPHAVRAQAVSPEAPEAATARELSSTAAALERALDSLVPRLRRAQAEADSVRARRRAERLATRAPMDTVEVGAAVVVTPRGEGEGARAFLEVVWEDEYGDWAPAEARPGGPWIAFQWSADRMDFHLPDRTLIRVQGAPWRTREYMEEGARDAFGAVLTRTLQETGVGHWLDGMMVRSPERPRWIWRGMATTASAPVRACLHGELSACATALSLETDATPFDEWYTLEQRRLLVRRNARLWTRYAEGREVMRACLDGDDASCDEALALYRERQLGGPGEEAPEQGEVVGQPHRRKPPTQITGARPPIEPPRAVSRRHPVGESDQPQRRQPGVVVQKDRARPGKHR